MTTIFDGSLIVRVATDPTGAPANGATQQVVVSPGGTKVAFTSAASNLVPDDTNGTSDIFVRDLVTGAIDRLSTDATGAQANGASANPVFSPDGSKIAFVSVATNLAGNNYPWADLYIKDLATGALQKVATNVEFVDVSFSPDGSQLLLLNHDPTTNSVGDVYLVDLASGATTFVSGAAFGSQASAVFSADGTKIAFTAGAGLGYPYITGIYVKDLATGETKVIADNAAYYAADSVGPVFSPDGTKLAYSTVIPGTSGGRVYVEDLVTGERELVSTSPSGWWISDAHAPVFSPDGTKIAFWADSGGFQGTSGYQVLIRDLVTGTLMVASTDAAGNPIHHDPSWRYDLSWNGDKLAFVSQAGNDFAPGGDPAHLDAFIRLMSFVSVTPFDAVKSEGDFGTTPFTFTVTRSGDTSLEQSVQWTASDLYAHYPWQTDATASGTINFAPGETSRIVVVEKKANTTMSYDRPFEITLSQPTDGLLVDGAKASGTVLNDDVRPHDDAFLVAAGEDLHVAATAPESRLETKGGFFGGPGLPTLLVTMSTHGLGGVLANDDTTVPLTASLVHGPAHGTLVFAADGHFDYAPDAGFSGIDRFTYSVDGTALPSERQALIYVLPQLKGETTTLNLVALTPEEQIAATYISYFGRGADAVGFDFWVDRLHAGQATQTPAMLLANIASSFAVSGEAKNLYPFLANPQGATSEQIGNFLNGVYVNLFHRTPDAAGRAYWTDQVNQNLADGEFVGSVLVDILSGAQNTPSGHHDISTLMGKVAVGLAYVHEQETFGVQWTPNHLIEARTILQEVTDDPGTVLLGVAFAQNVIAATYGGN